jgi:uncharacterized protein (UPF0332 family)
LAFYATNQGILFTKRKGLLFTVYNNIAYHFIKTQKVDKKFGKLYAQLLTWRHKGDYDDFFDFEEKNVVQYLEPVEEFIRMIENLIGEKKLGN